MRTISAFVVLLAIAFFYSGCKDSGSVFNLPGVQSDKMEFTMSGSADGETTAPGGLLQPYRHFEGEGTTTPGGTCQITMDYWAIPTNPPTNTQGISKYGNGVITTETGDKIYGLITTFGTWTMDPNYIVTAVVPLTIAGGTGEYDNIVGEVILNVTLNNITRETEATWSGTFTHARPFGGQFTSYNGTVQNPSCSAGYTRRHADGTGTAIHLGNCTIEVEHCFNFTTGVIKDGQGFFTANNGDRINATYDGYAVPIPGTTNAAVKMFCTITGGTGKYANATGFVLNSAVQTAGGVGNCILEGVIDFSR